MGLVAFLGKPPHIQINFAVEPGEEGDRVARFNFWNSPSTAQWFKDHGYILYQRFDYSTYTYPIFPSECDFNNAGHPYAYYDTKHDGPGSQPLEAYESRGKIAYAQDSLNRHVVIKIVPLESHECHILRFLHQQTLETLKDNCIIPVLDMLPIEGFCFVVMPRWGPSPDGLCIENIPQVVRFIHSLLKGLAYLHEHNIVHGDIAMKNVMANHFTAQILSCSDTRRYLCSQQRILYAIIDFDCSIMLPLEADRNNFRLPYYKSWGTFHLIKDTDAGEFDFNPFIFDVGVMGSLLCIQFQHLSRKLPILAPLLDRMTTWELDRRFTASEALHFYEDRLSEVTDDQMKLLVEQEHNRKLYDEYDRWEGLSPDFLDKWAEYRTPPLPWHMRCMRRLYEAEISPPYAIIRPIVAMPPHNSTQPPHIQINFSIEQGEEDDSISRLDFWNSPSTAQWFNYHGYTPYQRVGDSSFIYPTFPSECDFNNAGHPYAYYDTKLGGPGLQPLRTYESRLIFRKGKIAYAQDSLNRHVVIKIVPLESHEYRILRFLHQQRPETLKENCIIPVLDMLPIEGFCFVVMPRWGRSIDMPYMENIQQVVAIMHSMLKGLAYLHEHNIVHGDIALRNVVANHFTAEILLYSDTRRYLRSQQRLLYAIIDFDWSIMLPSEADRNNFRLPYYKSWGTFHLIKDTDAGEFDFNPFIFDVGVMGSLLCMEYQHMSQRLPMLAPLLDRMTTWELDRRFTASEALHFFEDRLSEVTDEQLQLGIYEERDKTQILYDKYDRWEGLSPDFLDKWAAYRTPPLPWHMRCMRRLYEAEISPPYAVIRPIVAMPLHNSTKPPHIKINFSLDQGEEDDNIARLDFWNSPSTSQWFNYHGYTLYQRVSKSSTIYPTYPPECDFNNAGHPYAYYDTNLGGPGLQPLRTYESRVSPHLRSVSCDTRRYLRSQQRILYAIIDFDCSTMLPSEADRNNFRLPYYKSWGTFRLIKDTDAGEFDFNPFIFDVGVMGSLLCMEYQHMSQRLPMLAPLLDRMTTWELDRRFTAPEALHFFKDHLSEVTDEQLQLCIYEERDKTQILYDKYDRWEGLSSDFLDKWAAYRTPPLPWHMRCMRRLYEAEISTKMGAISKMDLVYGTAYATIVAAFVADANAGLPGLHPGSRGVSQPIEEIGPGFRLAFKPRAGDLIGGSVHSTRAWTFQERLFAKRNLTFIGGQIVFGCRKAPEWREDQIFEDQHRKTHGVVGSRNKDPNDIREFEGLIQSYPGFALTFREDIYNAFAGLTRYFKTELKATLCHGTPDKYFDWFLIWGPLDAQIRQPDAPSWSWSGWSGSPFPRIWDWYDRSISRIRAAQRKRSWVIWYQRRAHDSEDCIRTWTPKADVASPSRAPRNFYGGHV
ncbi:hypothetical protein CVT25_009958 [Psilocybe cyanescens]|uniref:Protein kinase domain-containing protein n=1 Tax=Psilocybe cyanescens TaxID=93625 RepID=A0A409XCQ0_PSICY|nr:hypothetical protein CVT25_009958 [Psilocybe cyanescens]